MGWGNSSDPAAPRLNRNAPAGCAVLPCQCKKISTIRLVALEFVNDHKKLHDYKADFRPSGRKYKKPEWEPGTSNPVSFSMGDHVEVWLTFKVEPEDACPETGGVIGHGPKGIDFDLTNYTFVPGINKIYMIANRALPSIVQILNFAIDWETTGISADFELFGNSTENKMYVTYGKPYVDIGYNNTVTEKRLEWLCTLCAGDSNGHDSVAKIHKHAGKYTLGTPTPKSHWLIAGGEKAECIDLSKFYVLATEMLGLRTPELVFLYPMLGKKTKESTSSKDREWRLIDGEDHQARHAKDTMEENLLLVDFHGGWNRYEACMKFTHPDKSGAMKTRYYAGGAGTYDTPEAVMKDVCKLTHWTYETDRRHLGGYIGENICLDPGPSPAEVWKAGP